MKHQPIPLWRTIADDVVSSLSEFDDRTSPEDQPEMMLVTGEELSNLIARAFERAAEDATSGYAVLLHELHSPRPINRAEADWSDVWARFASLKQGGAT